MKDLDFLELLIKFLQPLKCAVNFFLVFLILKPKISKNVFELQFNSF